MKKNPLFWFGVVFLGLLVLASIFVPMFKPYDYKVGPVFAPPSAQFWMGTDHKGYDIAARLAYGARVSLLIGLSVQAIALVVGLVLGVVSVFGPRWLSNVILRLTDGMFAFPDILLAILIIGIWNDRGIRPVVAALAITAWPGVVRLVRAQVASLKDREFVVASRALGGSVTHAVLKHILPHIWPMLMAVLMVELAGTILAESALSFLGIGVQPPTPSWGMMISDARSLLNAAPMQLIWPCVVLSLTIFALNFLGDGLRAALDPKKGEG